MSVPTGAWSSYSSSSALRVFVWQGLQLVPGPTWKFISRAWHKQGSVSKTQAHPFVLERIKLNIKDGLFAEPAMYIVDYKGLW